MPLHDWSRVPDNVFHNFHVMWLGELAGSLNEAVLPEGYLARAEEYLWPYQADLLALETGSDRGSRSPGANVRIEPTATITPPRFHTRKERRIAIFSARDERRVALLEVVSPGNKDSPLRARRFRDKVVDCIAGGLHVLVVDVLAATEHAPGIGAAVAREIGSEAVPEEGRCATSFEVERDPPAVRIYHRRFVTGERLPDAPLFLEPGFHVAVPIEETYELAIRRLPRADRARLGPDGEAASSDPQRP